MKKLLLMMLLSSVSMQGLQAAGRGGEGSAWAPRYGPQATGRGDYDGFSNESDDDRRSRDQRPARRRRVDAGPDQRAAGAAACQTSAVDADGDIVTGRIISYPAAPAAGAKSAPAQFRSAGEKIFNNIFLVSGIVAYFTHPEDLRNLARACPERAEDLKKLFEKNMEGLVERHGKDGVLFGPQGNEEDAAMWLAALEDTGAVVFLLEHGVNIKATNSNSETPLHAAASQGKVAVAVALLNALPEADRLAVISMQPGWMKRTALHAAAYKGHVAVVNALLNTVPETARKTFVCIPDWCRRTALHEAAGGGHAAVVDRLLNALPEPDRIAFVHITDQDGWTALHVAGCRGHAAVVDVLLKEVPEGPARAAFICMFASGSDTGLPRSIHSGTALYWAAVFGEAEVVRRLLNAVPEADRAACVGIPATNGRTARDAALYCGHSAVVELF